MGLSGKNGSHYNQKPPKQQQNAVQKPKEKHSVHWFRKGLRLHDNPALIYALKNAKTFRCVFVIDPWFAGSMELNLTKHCSNVGINKWRFLLQCLEDLDQSLRKLNSRLFVIRGQPADVLPKLLKKWGTTCLTFEKDPEPYGKVRDAHLTEICKELNIEVITAVSHTLYKLEKIIEKNGGRAPLTYHQFQAIVADMPGPPKPEPMITFSSLGKAITPLEENDDDNFGTPTLEELGFDTIAGLKQPVWIGGETEALLRLARHLERKAWVASFGRPKMTPQSLLASQTGLSPYLRFGCLSTRLFYYQLTDLYQKIKKAIPPLSLHGQLLWREFFYCAATMNPNFDKIAGNPICVQINWDKNTMALSKWANGQTGFPWIDAIMYQLREEGWIHHLARHAVACFLTRGDLWLSWENGMKVFEELLLDADWSVNAGMWMWLSCSSFFQQFFHCYCPVKFGRKADPHGDYIRRYLPALKNYPNRFIHEPWNAPENVQKAAKCIIGKDYPLPMVNHAVASRTNLERMKQVYQQLSKYRGIAAEHKTDTGGSALQNLLSTANLQASTAFVNSSPSPTSILTLANNSGNYLCRSNPASQNVPNQQVLTFHQSTLHNRTQQQQQHGTIHNSINQPPQPRLYSLQNHKETSPNVTPTPTKPQEYHEQEPSNPSYNRIIMQRNSSAAVNGGLINQLPTSNSQNYTETKPPDHQQFSYQQYQMDSVNSEIHQQQHLHNYGGVYCKTEGNNSAFIQMQTDEHNDEMHDKEESKHAHEFLNGDSSSGQTNGMQQQCQIEQQEENKLNMEMNAICNIGEKG